MAALTDQLGTVNSGKPIIDPGPVAPSWLEGIARGASAAVPGLAQMGQDRARRTQDALKAEAERAIDEAAGMTFDALRTQVGSTLAAPPQLVNSGPAAFAPELDGSGLPSDATSHARDLTRAQRAVTQGRLPQAGFDLQLERIQAELFQKYPDQRAEISQYFLSQGLNHYMFRAATEDANAYKAEQEAQLGAASAQYKYAADRGLITREMSLDAGAAIGRGAMQDEARLQAAKDAWERARQSREMDRQDREEVRQETSKTSIASIIANINRTTSPMLDQVNAAIAGAGTDAERQRQLGEIRAQVQAGLMAYRQRAVADVQAAGGNDDDLKAVQSTIDGLIESTNSLFTTSFEQNSVSARSLSAALNIDMTRALPMWSRISAAIGPQAANAVITGLDGTPGLSPDMLEAAKKEMLNFDPTSPRGTMSLARAVAYMRGEVGLKDLSSEEAVNYIRANAAAMEANQRAVLSGSAEAVRPWSINYGNVVEAVTELSPQTASIDSVWRATRQFATPQARQALDKTMSTDKEFGESLAQASRAAAAHAIQVARGIPRDENSPYVVEFDERTGNFAAKVTTESYNAWARRMRPRIRQGALPTMAEMQAKASNPNDLPTEVNQRSAALNQSLAHLLQTDKYDEAIPSTLTARERREMYALGRQPASMRRTNADGATSDAWETMLGNLNSTVREFVTGTLNTPLARDPNDLDWAVRTVYGEAAGEGAEGWRAVAATIFNRAEAGNFGGRTLRDVVMAPNQYEPWNNTAARRRMESLDPNSETYKNILAVVQQTQRDRGQYADYTHFYAPRAQAALGRRAPSWDDGTGTDIGNHRFFVNPGRRND